MASISAKKKKHFHHMGALSYDEKRKDWIDSGLYDMFPKPTSSSDISTVSTSRTDRAAD